MINMSTVYPIGFGNNQEDNENYDKLMTVLNRSVSGKTPLCKHIHEVALSISKMKKELKRKGQKVCVMIATGKIDVCIIILIYNHHCLYSSSTSIVVLIINIFIIINFCSHSPLYYFHYYNHTS